MIGSKLKSFMVSIVATTYCVVTSCSALACTSIAVADTKGNIYHARTMEFAGSIPSQLTYMPAGTKIESVTPANKPGVTFNTKYAILGMSGEFIKGTKQPTVGDAINDQGLSFSANALPSSTSTHLGSDDSKILSAADFGTWVLGNFKTVDEVKKAMASGETQIWLPNMPLFGNIPLPLHYAIHDKNGGAIVVEFQNGMANVYENPANVMTNGPGFPWHLENLNNYTFTNMDKNTGQLGKLKLATHDAGIATTALPAAETSQGRFVKAAFYANYVRKGATPDEAIVQLAHIMNNFDRPYDLTIDGAGGMGDGPRGNSISSEITTYTFLKDLSRGRFYVRSINAMNWAVVDFASLKNVNQVKTVSIYDVDKAGADVFNLSLK